MTPPAYTIQIARWSFTLPVEVVVFTPPAGYKWVVKDIDGAFTLINGATDDLDVSTGGVSFANWRPLYQSLADLSWRGRQTIEQGQDLTLSWNAGETSDLCQLVISGYQFSVP